MKFKAAQRTRLPSIISRAPAPASTLRSIQGVVRAACDGKSAPRKRLTLATETLARIYNRPVSQIIHAIYTDSIRGRVFADDAPADSETAFWERFAALL